MLSRHICRNAAIVVAFQCVQQGIFRIFPHRQAVGLATQMTMPANVLVVKAIQMSSQVVQILRINGLLSIHQSAQRVPHLDHSTNSLASSLCFRRYELVVVGCELIRQAASQLVVGGNKVGAHLGIRGEVDLGLPFLTWFVFTSCVNFEVAHSTCRQYLKPGGDRRCQVLAWLGQ